MKCVVRVIFLTFFIFNIVYGGWGTLLKNGSSDKTLHDNGSLIEGNIYQASITYQFDGSNPNGIYDSPEKVYIKVVGKNGEFLETPSQLTKKELEDWANANAAKLMKLLFGGDPSQTIFGQSTSVTNSVIATEQSSLDTMFQTMYTTKVLLDSESVSSKNFGKKASASAGVFNYSKDLSKNSSYGVVFTYKYNEIDDYWNSKSTNFTLIPFYKIISKLNPKVNLETVVNLVGGLVYMESDFFPAGAGYYEYGIGVSTTPKYQLSDKCILNASVSYQVSKKHIPTSKVSDEMKFIADAINNLTPTQTLTLGAGANYQINKDWEIAGDVLHSIQLKTENFDEGRDKSTYYTLKTTYELKNWTLGFGYKIVTDIADYDENTYMAKIKYKW